MPSYSNEWMGSLRKLLVLHWGIRGLFDFAWIIQITLFHIVDSHQLDPCDFFYCPPYLHQILNEFEQAFSLIIITDEIFFLSVG